MQTKASDYSPHNRFARTSKTGHHRERSILQSRVALTIATNIHLAYNFFLLCSYI